MSTVLLGTNRFSDCATLIAWGDQSVLRAPQGLGSLELDTRNLGPAIAEVHVVRGTVTSGVKDVRPIGAPNMLSIVRGEQALLYAIQLDEQTLHIKLDLRPLGINIFDDVEGLHVGRNLIAHNTFSRAQVAIRLA